jgi:hypothetical protein
MENEKTEDRRPTTKTGPLTAGLGAIIHQFTGCRFLSYGLRAVMMPRAAAPDT